MPVEITPYPNNPKILRYEINTILYDGRKVRIRKCDRLKRTEAQLREWAEREERKMYADSRDAVLKPAPVEAPKVAIPTLREWAYVDPELVTKNGPSAYIKHATSNGATSRTLRIKRTVLENHLLPYFGTKRLDEITTELVETFKEDLLLRTFSHRGVTGKYSPRTRGLIVRHLQAVIFAAVKREVLVKSPCVFVHVKVHKPRPDFYSREVVDKMLAAATPAQRVMILLGVQAGLRAGEMLALEWADVTRFPGKLDISKQVARKQVCAPKSGKGRLVRIAPELARALADYKQEWALLPNPTGSDRIFLTTGGRWSNRHAGMPHNNQSQLRVWMKEVQTNAGLKVTGRLHILRHTFCTWLAMANTPIQVIRDLAGHSSITVTEVYLGVGETSTDDAIARVFAAPKKTRGKRKAKAKPKKTSKRFH